LAASSQTRSGIPPACRTTPYRRVVGWNAAGHEHLGPSGLSCARGRRGIRGSQTGRNG
jgi:hypothetical protein